MAEKIFNFEENGLRYTVTLTQEDGGPVMYTITVHEGQMDVNALYWGDDDHSGRSENLGGPLNMNGAGSRYDGQKVQWDDAVELSRPGLGPQGSSKETFLAAGDELGPRLLSNDASLDEISFLGVRATSTSTPEGSIKGVSVPEEPEDPGDPDCELPDGANKVLFLLPETEGSGYGITILSHDAPLPGGLTKDQAIRLDSEIENPTLQDYYDKMVETLRTLDELDRLDDLSEIKVYTVADDGRSTLLGTFGVGEPLDDDSPLPIICAEQEEVVEMDEDEDSQSLVA